MHLRERVEFRRLLREKDLEVRCFFAFEDWPERPQSCPTSAINAHSQNESLELVILVCDTSRVEAILKSLKINL